MQAQEKVGEKLSKYDSHSYKPKETTKCILVVNNKTKNKTNVYNLASGDMETKHKCLPNWIGIWKIKKIKI